MGDGTMKYISKEKYNDDKWHIIEVTRDKKQSILKVDEKTIDQGAYPGSSSNLEVNIKILCYLLLFFEKSVIYTEVF